MSSEEFIASMDSEPEAHGHPVSLVSPLHLCFNVSSSEFPGSGAIGSKDSSVDVLKFKPLVVKFSRVGRVTWGTSLDVRDVPERIAGKVSQGVISERVASDPLSEIGDFAIAETGVGVLCGPWLEGLGCLVSGCSWEGYWSPWTGGYSCLGA